MAELFGDNVAGLAGSPLTAGAAAKFAIALLHDHAEDTIPEWGSVSKGLERRAQAPVATHLGRSVVEYEVAR